MTSEILWLLFSKAGNNVQVLLFPDSDNDTSLGFPYRCMKTMQFRKLLPNRGWSLKFTATSWGDFRISVT